ncbi:DUF2927 domain-containing protein [Aestuariivita sp.]|jgi:hypothetical protein|uniref:DUF2927 domain-containing protein n=1 Tax=Aestuariivita sp. TaxID=1872407 RepID=UPI00217334A2|nr:DUF2927 domain-containing protein [Aestuariivita sp.]MCE8009330.1 DUF2927 domain-containing protein [Aestuariivita sp.]
MTRVRTYIDAVALAGVGVLLAGCAMIQQVEPVPTPPSRPAALVVPGDVPRSLGSEQLTRYYGRLQADLVAQGLLRTDGGGPDTPYTADVLARNFERIAFFDEYAQGAGLTATSRDTAGKLRRWSGPVRMDISFGNSVPTARRDQDRASVRNYVRRLARVTGHPISYAGQGNFHVLFMSEDDTDQMIALLRQKVPNISDRTLEVITSLPRSIHCLVVAFSGNDNPQNYTRAVAVIRAEHPDLIRLSCIHEELAQGLGLANDSPDARPSIFNDDDEFALLTSHDEQLLSMLYDPRLNQGMDADAARPVIRILARELMGQQL